MQRYSTVKIADRIVSNDLIERLALPLDQLADVRDILLIDTL